jgi:hypothetical protein
MPFLRDVLIVLTFRVQSCGASCSARALPFPPRSAVLILLSLGFLMVPVDNVIAMLFTVCCRYKASSAPGTAAACHLSFSSL